MRQKILLTIFSLIFINVAAAINLPAKGNNGSAWEKDLNLAVQKAKRLKKPLFIHFYTPWCPYCVKMQNETFKDSRVKKLMASYVKIMVNVGTDQMASQTYQVQGVPDNRLYLAGSMTMIMRIPGYLPPESFTQELVKTNEYLSKNKKLLREYSMEKNSGKKQKLATRLGEHFYKIEEYNKAVFYYGKSTLGNSINAQEPFQHKKYGFALMATGSYKKAITEYQKFIDLVQKNNQEEYWKGKFLIAFSQMKIGDKSSARENFSLVSKNTTNAEIKKDAEYFHNRLDQELSKK